VALFIDSKVIKGQSLLIAIGVTDRGVKRKLGLVHTNTETVCLRSVPGGTQKDLHVDWSSEVRERLSAAITRRRTRRDTDHLPIGAGTTFQTRLLHDQYRGMRQQLHCR
jgi:hypothetical protein